MKKDNSNASKGIWSKMSTQAIYNKPVAPYQPQHQFPSMKVQSPDSAIEGALKALSKGKK